MTELQLYKFIHETNIEIYWATKYESDSGWLYVLYAHIPFYHLEGFAEMIKRDIQSSQDEHGGIEVLLQTDGIIFNISELCEDNGIDPENILSKHEERR